MSQAPRFLKEFVTLGDADRELVQRLVATHGPLGTARLLCVGEATLDAARDPYGVLKASTAKRVRASLEDVRAVLGPTTTCRPKLGGGA